MNTNDPLGINVTAFALRIVRDEAYREALLLEARERRLHPVLERTLWEFAYGKPVVRTQILDAEGKSLGLGKVRTSARLAERVRRLTSALSVSEADSQKPPKVRQKRTDSWLRGQEAAFQQRLRFRAAAEAQIRRERERAEEWARLSMYVEEQSA